MKCTFTKFLILLLFISNIFFSCSNKTIKEIDDKEANTALEIIEKAQLYYDQKEYKKAIREYNQIISLYANDRESYEKELAWANYEIGFCYLVIKKYDIALKYFNKVIKEFSIPAPVKLAQDRLREINAKNIK